MFVLLVAALSLGPLGAASTAQTAADSGPPDMELRWSRHSTQEGLRWSYCWQEADEPGLCADKVGGFPKAMWVRSGATLRIRIHHAEKPDEFGVTTWRRVDGNGSPKGRGDDVDVTLRRVERDGETRAWDAVFDLGGQRHHYLMAFGVWSQGDASWRFHVRTLQASQ